MFFYYVLNTYVDIFCTTEEGEIKQNDQEQHTKVNERGMNLIELKSC